MTNVLYAETFILCVVWYFVGTICDNLIEIQEEHEKYVIFCIHIIKGVDELMMVIIFIFFQFIVFNILFALLWYIIMSCC